MRRNFSMIMIGLLLAALFALGGVRAPQTTVAATEAATTAPTKVATIEPTPAATTAATKAPTKAPTKAAATKAATPVTASTPQSGGDDQGFAKAPAPDAGSLGVTLSDADPVTIIATYPSGPADKAGLQPGDELLELNGTAIKDRESLISSIVAAKPGDTLTFVISRDGDEQEIKVPVKTRREVYCPVPEKKLTEGDAVLKDPLGTDKNWTLTGDSTKGVDKVVKDNTLTFTTDTPDDEWVALVNLRSKSVLEYAVTVEIKQTGRAVAGVLLNVTRQDSYRLQFLPNGSWQMSALVSGQESSGGLSFGETILNAQKNPTDTVTNTIKVTTDGNDMFFYFNGKFACGVPLYIFADPPLDAGSIALYAVVAGDPDGKANVSFGKLEFNAVKVDN
jgi:membrane-associated protease RseP (regulator of RpoE activity)